MANNKQNLHIHTTYTDGKDTPEEIVLEAIGCGFDSIGFSEHSFNRFSSFPYQLKVEDMDGYKNEIRALKAKYKGQIDIFCGLELDLFSDVPTDGLDYLIGSVHSLNINGYVLGFDTKLDKTLAYINENFDGDGMRFAKQYYQTLSDLFRTAKVDIIGHFDLITKNNELGKFIDTSSEEYLSYGLDAIRALQGKAPLFEVNTGAVARGYRTSPYPQMEFLREFRRLGFGVVITSDCHDKTYLDCFYDEAKERIAAAGFTSKWILTDDGFTEVAL